MKLGYCCINTELTSPNKGCVVKTIEKNGVGHSIELAKKNLEAVMAILEWNFDHHLHVYRMSSDMLPQYTNPMLSKDGRLFDLAILSQHFDRLGELSKRYDQRLTFHPGQFNQVGTPRWEVFEKTRADLSMHADILDRIGCSPNSVIVVHGGGSYGDKPTTMTRWSDQFKKLPLSVQQRLVIENCERQYNYSDILELSKAIDRPVVFDLHHHQCYSQAVEEQPDPETFIDKIIATWSAKKLRPKLHISNQAEGKRLGAHSDYVDAIPDYLLKMEVDLMIEAKAKEGAVLRLKEKYGI